jgi:hypothetical protein
VVFLCFLILATVLFSRVRVHANGYCFLILHASSITVIGYFRAVTSLVRSAMAGL